MRRLALIFVLVLLSATKLWALSGDGGTVLLVQNGKVFFSGSTVGTMPYISSANTLSLTAQGAANTLLHGNGAAAPTWSAVSLTADVTGILPEANGGTNANTSAGAQGGVFYQGASSTGAVSAAGTSGQCLKSGGTSAPTWGSCGGAPVLAGFGAGMGVTASTTVYSSPSVSLADTTEKNIYLPVRTGTMTFSNLYCSTTTPPGVASGTMFVVFRTTTSSCTTAPSANCTAAPTANTGAGCSATSASTTAQTTCTDTGTTATTTGECIDWCITPGAGWATGAINCTVERTA